MSKSTKVEVTGICCYILMAAIMVGAIGTTLAGL